MHYYKGEPFYHYCLRMGYNYGNIIQFVNYKNMTIDDAIAYYLSKKGTKDLNNVKYIIDGVPVRRILTREQYQHFTREIYKNPQRNWRNIFNEVKND